METKTLREIMDEHDQKTWGPGPAVPRETTEKILPVQRLKLVRDGGIRYQAPVPPITSPEHCIDIFRTHFNGADREIVAAISLDMQNQFLGLSNVAVGTIGHVIVHPREVFKYVLAKDNAAKFILAHNHPTGTPEPSIEDLEMMAELRDIGIRIGCRMADFVIIGQNSMAYYSHRELHFDYF